MTTRKRPTRRQLEVLRAYIAGRPDRAAVCELGISESTAREQIAGL